MSKNIFNSNKQIDIDGLIFDFSEDRLSIYGDINVGADKVGLKKLEAILEVISDAKHELQFKKLKSELPNQILDKKVENKTNPFA